MVVRHARDDVLWRRVARIYPAHLVALALAIPVFYSVSPDPEQWWVKPFGAVLLLSIPLLQGWSRDPSVLFSGNPAAWTLTCEAFFYALHPALQRPLLAVRTRGALLFAAGTIVVALTYRTAAMGAPGSWWSSGLPWPVVRLSEFFLGMCLAWAVRSGWRPRLRPWFGYAAALGLVGLLIVCRTPAAPASVARWVNGSANELAMVVCALMIVLVAVRDLAGRPRCSAPGPWSPWATPRTPSTWCTPRCSTRSSLSWVTGAKHGRTSGGTR